MAPPALPDLDELAKESAWVGACDGLAEELDRLGEHAEVAGLRTFLRFCWFSLLGLADAGRGRSSAGVRRARQLVAAGGPAYVKVGQSIATAQGLLPDEWVAAFAWCRDEVPAMP